MSRSRLSHSKISAYVEGYHFEVITDHGSLKWLCNLRNLTGRLARWALELQGYDYTIEHRKGSLNHVLDALSRMFEDDDIDEGSTPVIAGISPDKEPLHSQYVDLRAKVAERPLEHPGWKVVGNNLYHYHSDPLIDETLKDDDAWQMVLPDEKRQ